MCQTAGLHLLSRSESGYVGYCPGCDRYNLVFENIFLLLSEQEVRGLGQIIDLNYGVWTMTSPIGQGKTIGLQTPVPNTFFTFNSHEFEEFKRLVNETILLLEAKEIINHKNS